MSDTDAEARLQELVYAVSHDLRASVRAVVQLTTVLQEECLDLPPEAAEALSLLEQAGLGLHHQLQGLLELSRVVTRGGPMEPVSLDEVLADAVLDHQRQASAPAVVTHDALPTLTVDREQVGRLLVLLLDNTVSHGGPGPLHVHVGAEAVGPGWRLVVQDDGAGHSGAHPARLLLPMNKGHHRPEARFAGMGLSICARIAERHGWRLSLPATPTPGFQVSIELPGDAS